MNERIREQAEWRFADKATGNFSEYDKLLEKFAELIVRECSNKIEDQKDTAPPQVAAGLNFAQVIIKQHFGVE